ncbi:serine threonine-protein kinase mtor [Lasius niger]|uniref:Serine/threonine-protein kinase TOR n=1 Tax=Lasius niger TaxID=67767 RepID=A0A0J7KQX2_LASNI|nr:serine threonine-protein kinase mtor [Lasius niger]
MVSASDINEKKGGILAIVCLIGADVAEYVEFEVKRAFEWLGADRHEGRRHAAVLVLRELAVSVPTYFFQQVTPFFDLIFNAIHDPKPAIREGAVEALRAALVVTAQRETAKQMHKSQWYKQCYDEVVDGFEEIHTKERGINRDDRIHGSLLVLNELLRCSNVQWERNYEALMERLNGSMQNENDILSLMPRLKTTIKIFRNPHIQHALMMLLPRLAAFNKEKFIRDHLKESLAYLLLILRSREKDRYAAFTSIGFIAVAVEDAINPYLPKIMEVIKSLLPSKETPSKKRTSLEPAVFVCITLLGHAVKQVIASDVRDLLEPMFQTGLSPILTTALRELAHSIPSLQVDISQGLLRMLSQVLMQKPLRHPGAPWTVTSPNSTADDVSSTVLALKTLGTFNFDNNPLLQFVKRCADHFLTSEQAESGPTVITTVSTVLGKLLVVGITDTDPDVRLWVLASLDDSFDVQLAQAENLSALFIAMNDEMFEIRELAVRTVGRLSTLNPAYVMPSLRKTLVQFLTELEHSGMGRNKEQAARMLDHLVVTAPRLVRPYMEPILKVLVPKLKESDPNPGVILAVLRAIGDLAEVNGAEMQQWMPELSSILLEMLVDASSPEKRGVALWVFGQLVGSTGHVVKPYMQYPTLLDVLINFLKTEQQPIIRRETIRVLGLLGALDPYKHKMNLGQIDCQLDTLSSMADTKSDVENIQDLTTSEMLVNMSPSTLEEFYPAIAITTLMRIIREPTLSQHHTMVLAVLIAIVKQHIRNYLDDIFTLIKEFWTIAVALGAEFKIYLPQLMPPILRVLTHDSSKDRAVTVKLLLALQTFGNNLDNYLHLVLPPIVKLFYANDYQCPELRNTAMDTLCAVVMQLGKKYQIFIVLVQKVMTKHKIVNSRYDVLVDKILTDTTTADAWTATRRVSKDDWLEWLRCFSIGLLKESPSPALRSCWALAQTYAVLPRDLFNAAFVSCWTELNENYRTELIQTLHQALMVPDLPAEVTQTILNLAEFMEHCDKGPLPLDNKILGDTAMHCRAYAKALHYKEDEFHKSRSSNIFESLISINNKLQQKEAAEGLLEYVMNQHNQQDLKVQIRWYEKLHNWDKALQLYQERLESDSADVESTLGEMRCLEALGEWGQLHEVATKQWSSNQCDDIKQRMSRMAAAAAWGLGQWESMQKYVSLIPKDTQDGAFYRAVLAIHDEQYNVAHQLIDSARDLMDTELTAMAGESYQRAYNAMVEVQKLAELEEVIQFKLVPERRAAIKAMWWERLQGGQRIVEDWQKIIQVHTLVVSPQDDMYTWLKYASLCRKSGSLMLCHKTLVMLMGTDPSLTPDQPLPTTHPQVTFAYCKHLWVANKREEAYGQLQRFVQTYLQITYSHPTTAAVTANQDDEKQHESKKRLLARCYLKLGEWLEALQGINERSIPAVLSYYAAATEHDPTWYKAWHAFAYTNYETVLFYKHQQGNDSAPAEAAPGNNGTRNNLSQYISQFTVPAVEGFFRSINLSDGNSLQDTLRLLTLWFDYGQWPEVYDAVVEGIRLIEINTWLQVIPQLIARIDTPRALVGRCVHHLLIDIGKTHPQALVYPLTVASKSASHARKTAANKILKSMCEHSPTLVQQAIMASDELIRVAILWHELWHEGLEEASRLYFGERNVRGMFDTLEPLHAMLERGPQTLKETSFNQAYGRDLMEAQEWCHRYKASRNVRDLNQAWDLYYHVFRRISRQLPQLTSLELQYVSPKLLLCRDLELAVPGSYSPGQPIVRIASIHSSMQVITSKQRPRKLCIKGSNGKDYMFLLKGHEDLRQDERVMQLFGLVNTLLLHDPDTFRRNLTIQRYAVIPLSTNSGLIGWVPYCDTLHTLIRDYREKKKILLNIEHRIMLRMAPDYDHLMLMQKVEVFEHALEHTHGDDLARLLWLKSPSSEIWFDRRTNYTRSLAVMSMVGYILGLGDRHPSNLMLDRLSGKILHIDFGDCFEVAMTREKFPEKIPFRLTRMLINAMEVTGIEGTYRRTCESVMSVLHRNKDSLMAVLEAFVYDPLLNWRLMDNAAPKGKRSDAQGMSASSSQEHGDMLDSLTATLPKKGVPCSIENGGKGKFIF